MKGFTLPKEEIIALRAAHRREKNKRAADGEDGAVYVCSIAPSFLQDAQYLLQKLKIKSL